MTTETDIRQKLYDKGADGFILKPFDLNDLKLNIYNRVKEKQSIVKTTINNKVIKYNKNSIEKSQREFFHKLASLKVISNPTDKLQLKIISQITKEFAKKLGFNKNEIQNIYVASKIKDIGLIGVNNIWDNKNKFTEVDRRNYGKYILLGHQLLSNSIETDFIKVAKNVVLQHRESYDGTGVPYQIKGESITVEAMIVMIVEIFEALLGYRSYRNPPQYTYKEAYEIFKKLIGKKFDPYLSKMFLKYFIEFVDLRKDIVEKERS
ncbi:metal dependent phosphohydrolase [hydrothermal vent metagenome]|uniref:Metal dependent phosphohydrolase n=1 Tax=hydrothermal vent metagenome TaxID=652676 RepID=A0A1W1EI86_9ZZZZ